MPIGHIAVKAALSVAPVGQSNQQYQLSDAHCARTPAVYPAPCPKSGHPATHGKIQKAV